MDTENKSLRGPILNVPMENLTWRVLIPEGFELTSHSGDFDLKGQKTYEDFSIVSYQASAADEKQSSAQNAVALLDKANLWLAAGDQEKASQAFSNAVRSNQLDAASGEDARVQLRELKTQQAVLGLNTRRQKVLLDNRIEMPLFKQAVDANPILRGDSNYDPSQFDRFLEGNSADENAALKEIANRIVTQQLAAEPSPVPLDIILPERGKVLTFTRSVQVESQSTQPMEITLDIKQSSHSSAWLAIPLCLLLGAMGARRGGFFHSAPSKAPDSP